MLYLLITLLGIRATYLIVKEAWHNRHMGGYAILPNSFAHQTGWIKERLPYRRLPLFAEKKLMSSRHSFNLGKRVSGIVLWVL